MSIPAQVNELRDLHREEMERAAQLPDDATNRFDPKASPMTDASRSVQKTMRRIVVSLNFSRFQSKEPGTPLYFGSKEAEEGLFWGSWKIATENVDVIARCLAEIRQHYGTLDRVLHDFNQVMALTCVQGLPNVLYLICHYPPLSDIGQDLYKDPQSALSNLLRGLKLPTRKARRSRSKDGPLHQLAKTAAAASQSRRTAQTIPSNGELH